MLSKLHTDGMLTKNSADRTVHLTGGHWPDLVDKPHFYYAPTVNWRSDLALRTEWAKDIGANHIRYSIHLEKFINPYVYAGSHEFDEYANQMDKAVQELDIQDMYGYFVLHYGSSAADPFMAALLDNQPYTFNARKYDGTVQGTYESAAVRDDWMAWCERLAEHYREIGNVFGYQIWAEPAWAGLERTEDNYRNILFPKWRDFNLETARAIHRGDPDALVIVVNAGYYWVGYMSPNQWDGQTLDEYNIVYGVQKYESEDFRGGAMQKAYDKAYEDWYNGNGTLETARELQELWYLEYLFNFAEKNQVPVFNNEFGYPYDLAYNHKDNREWLYCVQQAQGFYDIWRKYGQGWTQHRWQKGNGSQWGFFAAMDEPNAGDYTLAKSGELMSMNFSPLDPQLTRKLSISTYPVDIPVKVRRAAA